MLSRDLSDDTSQFGIICAIMENLPITAHHAADVERILESRPFSGASGGAQVAGRLFEFLAQATVAGRIAIHEQEISQALGIKKTSVASYVKRIRKRLADYSVSQGHRAAYEIYIPRGTHAVCVRPLSSDFLSPTPLNAWPADREIGHDISSDDFAAFLVSMCEAQGSMSEKDMDLRTWAQGVTRFSGLAQALDQDAHAFNAFFRRIRGSAKTYQPLRYSEMQNLMRTLGIHPLMLDPLLSSPTEDRWLSILLPTAIDTDKKDLSLQMASSLAEFRQTGARGTASYGFGARYAIPTKRIANTEASFVYLILDPQNGHSDDHHHPGDEFLFVVKGSARIYLRDTGSELELSEGGYVHFYSEQAHSAWNSSDQETHLLIVRFYQYNSKNEDTRQASRRRIWNTLSKRPVSVRTLRDLDWQWILEAAAVRSIPYDRKVPGEVLNRFGLARLLMQIIEMRKSVRKSGRGDHSIEKYRSLLELTWRIGTGRERVLGQSLPELAKRFGAFDILFWEFLFPGVLGQVVVHKRSDKHNDWLTLSEVFEAYNLGRPLATGVQYDMPRRTLACSDVAIAKLFLEPGTHCPVNQHPGTELCLALRGKAVVQYEERGSFRPICQITSGHNMAHYGSEVPHRIVNDDPSETAELLVLRMYGEPTPDASVELIKANVDKQKKP